MQAVEDKPVQQRDYITLTVQPGLLLRRLRASASQLPEGQLRSRNIHGLHSVMTTLLSRFVPRPGLG